MDHHRPVLGVVRARVLQPEALWHRIVELDRSQLPRAADRVGHVQVDLRSVEGAVALVQLVREPLATQGALERALGGVPHLVRADALLRPGGQLEPRLEAEDLVQEEPEVEAADDLVLDLLLGAEDVGVVLGEGAHPQQAVQHPAGLVAVDQAGLRVPDRKVPVGAAVGLVDLDVGGAVHGLQAHLPLLYLRDVHVVAIGVPVPRLLPELDVVEDRRAHLAVAAAGVLVSPQGGELVPDRHAGGAPERRPRR